MTWKSMTPRLKMPWMRISLAAARPWLPRFRNIEHTFRFIEKSEGFSWLQALVRHLARSLATTASCGDGIGRRPFPNDRLDTSGSSTPPLRGLGPVQSDTDRADVYPRPSR